MNDVDLEDANLIKFHNIICIAVNVEVFKRCEQAKRQANVK